MIEDLTLAQYEAALREDFATFVARCFADLNPPAEFAPNWHLEVIAAKLTDVRRGRIRRLIINLPPRHLKSLMASIAFPAWCLGHDPSVQILCASYGQDLADKFARDCRSIMTSGWYRRIFPTRLAAPRQAVQELITTRQGYRLATSTGGVLTGRGADIILIDDPLKPEEALSDAQRKAANEWYDHTLYSRQNDKRRGAIVIIMQRLQEDDLVGHVLAQEEWEVLRFPAIAETDEVHQIETIWGPERFTRRRGEALHPDREPPETLDRIRRTVGGYNFAGQYQQAPAPLGGGLVKAHWFKRYGEKDRPERFDRIVQSWDTANKATELSDFSVCTTWGVKGKDVSLIGLFRRRLEYPELKRAVREQQSLFGANEVLIEDKASDPADPGADRRRLPRRHAVPADMRQDHAHARADRDDRERLRPYSRDGAVGRGVSARDDCLPQGQVRRPSRFDRAVPRLVQTSVPRPKHLRALPPGRRSGRAGSQTATRSTQSGPRLI